MIIAVLYSCEINKKLKKLKWYYGEIFTPYRIELCERIKTLFTVCKYLH